MEQFNCYKATFRNVATIQENIARANLSEQSELFAKQYFQLKGALNISHERVTINCDYLKYYFIIKAGISPFFNLSSPSFKETI